MFFALGGYAMGMYLMRADRARRRLPQSDLPDFMVFLDWKELPWYWRGSDSFALAAARWSCWCPGSLAFVFGFFAFRSRIKGVYFSIITQALTFAAMLLFFRNETGFGGNNGFTDFKRILGLPDHRTRHARRRCSCSRPPRSSLALLHRPLPGHLQVRPRAARRSATPRARVMFPGYDPVAYKLFVWTLSAVLCGVAGALYVPQVGIINPSEMSPASSIEIAIWVAVGGRGTLIGPIVGAASSTAPRAGSPWPSPSSGCTSSARCSSLVTLFLPRGRGRSPAARSAPARWRPR